MKQVLQDLRTGSTYVDDVPCPVVPEGHILIRTRQTLVSVGTEKMLVDFGRANLLQKARQQPDKVRMVLNKIQTDGLLPTLEAVNAKLDQPIPMGYCNVGEIVQLGKSVDGFTIGERVISNGFHAEMVVVPKHLCARVPAAVSDDQASFTVMGAIALQGIRLVKPELGETVVVLGLGLVGLLTVQLLRAHGCRVLAADFNDARVQLARSYGADAITLGDSADLVQFALAHTNGRGVDAVLITASTHSSDPVHQAATMCRKRGRIVLVGVVGLELSRADFYEKELTFQVSCSYGPGRYDPDYEKRGRDYPLGFVRWTEQRNFEAVLAAIDNGQVSTDGLISNRYALEKADQAYVDIQAGGALGVILSCNPAGDTAALTVRTIVRTPEPGKVRAPLVDAPRVAFIGAGNYATRILMPAFERGRAVLKTVCCQGGASGNYAARKFGFSTVTTDPDPLLSDKTVDIVVVATRHDSHARYVAQALSAGKHVFVEKPLAISLNDLVAVEHAYAQSRQFPQPPLLMIGFNRRFSRLVQSVKSSVDVELAPACINMTVNAGAVPAESWIQSRDIGGGRIIGEVCHFVDLARYLADSDIVDYHIVTAGNDHYRDIRSDKCFISLKFANGSIASIQYLANGHNRFPKERIDVFWNGNVFQIDNFRKLRCYGGAARSVSLWRQDKGQSDCVSGFVQAVAGGLDAPIPFSEVLQVSRCVIDLAREVG